MSTEPAGAETPAAEVTTPAKVETPSEATAEDKGEASAPTTGEDSGDDGAAPPKRKHWAHERIDDITRQKHEALRDRDYWRSKYEESAKVDIDALDYDDQLVAKVRKAERQEKAENADELAKRLAGEHFGMMEDQARAKWADYDAVTQNRSLHISDIMASVIMDSETGTEVFYHLGKNPAEALRISRLPGHMQAVEMGKLEARLSQPHAIPRQPPAPVEPVNAIAAGGAKDPGAMTPAEYIAWRKANP